MRGEKCVCVGGGQEWAGKRSGFRGFKKLTKSRGGVHLRFEGALCETEAPRGQGKRLGEEGGRVRGRRGCKGDPRPAEAHTPVPAVSASQVCERQWPPVQSMTHCILIIHCRKGGVHRAAALEVNTNRE